MKKLLLFICCLALVSLVNCNKDKYTLTIALNDSATSGNYTAYAKLVGQGDADTATAKYSGSGNTINGAGTITIEDIEEDTYTWYIFIDSTTPNGATVDTGDRAAGGLDIEINDDMPLSVTSGWTNHL
jgi:hypothetical protein